MTTFTAQDTAYMQQALRLAELALEAGEVPVGAVVVNADGVIGQGYNQPIMQHDPCAHAEIVALRAAAQHLQNYRLNGTTLYVTLEPCLMCLGALLHARVARLVYATADPKVGAVQNALPKLTEAQLNHRLDCAGGLLAQPASALLKNFFKARR